MKDFKQGNVSVSDRNTAPDLDMYEEWDFVKDEIKRVHPQKPYWKREKDYYTIRSTNESRQPVVTLNLLSMNKHPLQNHPQYANKLPTQIEVI